MKSRITNSGAAAEATQSPGAGPSSPRPRPTPIPIIVPPPAAHIPSGNAILRVRTPTRTDTVSQEIELGVFLQPENSSTRATGLSLPSSSVTFARRGSAGSISVSNPGKSFFLSNPTWRVDILTFCSHVRVDDVLGSARVTHIQARKSRRLPFLHEYLLVFFTAARNQRFVMRLDRLGKVGSTSESGLLGWCGGRHGVASNTAIQEIGVYHIQDSQSGINSLDGPWLEMDGRWGSYPVATLTAWGSLIEGEHVSHHIQTAATHAGPPPRLLDVSRLLEAILLEMPTYHLTTTNCYFMTRSSLLLLHRCYSTAFACHLGETSSGLVPPSVLEEPVWAGLFRWYLPFTILLFLLYIPLLVLFHKYVGGLMDCGCTMFYTEPRAMIAMRYAMHSLLDVPLPLGMIHAYMTSLEQRMNQLVGRLGTQFLGSQMAGVAVEPFEVLIDGPWETLSAWLLAGSTLAVLFFLSMLFTYGRFVMFLFILVFGVYFNFKMSDSGVGILDEGAGIMEPPSLDSIRVTPGNDAADLKDPGMAIFL